MNSILILGRQPKLGLAELESLYGDDKTEALGHQVASVQIDPALLAFERLGGSIKLCRSLTTINTTNWKDVEKYLIQASPEDSKQMPEGKMRLGLSVIGFDISAKRIEISGLTIKKAIKKTGRNVRLVPNKSLELNSAQVIHNQLIGPTGCELVIIKSGDNTVIAQTIKVQNIDSYAKRDRNRPKRDTRVGMLPPKLAQIIVNLAAGRQDDEVKRVALDPFCGTGVTLQEAALMGYDICGSDIDPRMIEYSQQNMKWLEAEFNIQTRQVLEIGDATNLSWTKHKFDFVASETYLGRPFTSQPSAEILNQTINGCNLILKKFLRNIHGQIKPGTRLCLAVPAWQVRKSEFRHLPLVDQISDLGYNRVSFKNSGDEDLRYFREDQIVARQLLVLMRK